MLPNFMFTGHLRDGALKTNIFQIDFHCNQFISIILFIVVAPWRKTQSAQSLLFSSYRKLYICIFVSLCTSTS